MSDTSAAHATCEMNESQLPGLMGTFRGELGDSATACVSDQNFVKFLRWKYDVSRAVTRFHALREWLAGRGSFVYSPKQLRASEDAMLHKLLAAGIIICPTEMRDKDGHKLLIGRLRFNDFSDGRTTEDLVRLILYNIEHAIQDPETQRSGIAVFQDMRDVGPSNVSVYVPKLLLPALTGHYPVKLKAIYILNAPWFFRNLILPVVKIMMPTKLQERVFVLSDLEDLYKHIDRESLLEEHGGPKSHNQEAWLAARVAEEKSEHPPQLLADIQILGTT